MNTTILEAIESARGDLAEIATDTDNATALQKTTRARDVLDKAVDRLELEARGAELDAVLATHVAAVKEAKKPKPEESR